MQVVARRAAEWRSCIILADVQDGAAIADDPTVGTVVVESVEVGSSGACIAPPVSTVVEIDRTAIAHCPAVSAARAAGYGQPWPAHRHTATNTDAVQGGAGGDEVEYQHAADRQHRQHADDSDGDIDGEAATRCCPRPLLDVNGNWMLVDHPLIILDDADITIADELVVGGVVLVAGHIVLRVTDVVLGRWGRLQRLWLRWWFRWGRRHDELRLAKEW